ncbi:carboxylesterase/lipase family protein [Mucilaginibacter sp. 5C4]|uniref:carboxylesterase/lipase family protein n=1 Tax=Mucilaginibacter sp. 5C4 TaxID=3048589 RepID=UPI002AC992D3|nr:carboxylesterase/lipase family protein [Mucilaginibacter sp. 5C4]MEB0302521.1 carboxylesterase/lipase family protein [Mucilaginibacter sp. 5C4]WPX23740.1 carboxylesterase/lipase family protein [Mucilaginibacter sp. 5C4]
MKKSSLFFIATFVLFAYYSAKAQSYSTDNTILHIEAGKIRGKFDKSVYIFKNIPFAAPPVGNLRFAAPVKPTPWQGVRDAIASGPTAPFPTTKDADIDGKPTFGEGWVKGDNFLTTNVWTPNVKTGRLPVMVYIHGGAFVLGTSNVPIFDGTSFAKKGVVLVSFNYRLGIEGFLKIDGVPTNIGIRDQIAALKWVQKNIKAFGGDPSNVTVFGESAGAISVGVLVTSPAAKGLFKNAIMQSGSGQAVLSGEQADRIAKKYATTLHIKNTREAYMKFTPEQLVAYQPKVTPKMVKLETEDFSDPSGGVSLYFPVIDQDIVPKVPLANARNGAGSDYNLLIGYNTDEMNYFLVPTGVLKKIKLNLILNFAVKKVHPAPAKLISIYKKEYPKKNLGELFSAVLTSYQAQVPSIRFANAHALIGKTYMYEFAWPSSVANGTYGAYHGVEIPFVFNNLDIVTGQRGMLGPNGGPAELANKMQDAWVQFAKTGSPGWEAYDNKQRRTMLINKTWVLQTNPHAKILSAWDGVRDK